MSDITRSWLASSGWKLSLPTHTYAFISCWYNHGLWKYAERWKIWLAQKYNVADWKVKKTHKRSPSVKGGCRASRGNRLINDAPMFRKTRVMSRTEGTHTLKLWPWRSTITQQSILVLYQLYRNSIFGIMRSFKHTYVLSSRQSNGLQGLHDVWGNNGVWVNWHHLKKHYSC